MQTKILNAFAKITLKGWQKRTRYWMWECPKCKILIVRANERDMLKGVIRKHLYLQHGIKTKENGDYIV